MLITWKPARVVVVLILSCITGLAARAEAQGVGGIGGTLTDTSGAVLPGVTVTLLNPGTIGGNQETVTDERGAYQFTRLVPGRYGVKGELAGFRPAIQENVVVNADQTARVDLKLEVGQLSEAVVVKAEAPLLDTTSALGQTVMSREVLDSIPNRGDLWVISRSVPAVTFNVYDVGGSQSIQQSSSTIHGSTPAENAYLVDGMDVGYTGNTLGITMLYFNPYMFEQVNYQTANGSAERSNGGIAYNLVSKTGSNAYHGMYMFTGTRPSFISDNVSGALLSQLLSAVPARVLAVNPNIKPGQTILNMWDTAGAFGGPLLRDKLWFVASGKWGVLNQYRLGNYDLDGHQAIDDNRLRDLAVKLSWQAGRSAQLSYLYYLNNKGQFHRVAVAAGDYSDSRATYLDDKYPSVHQVKLTATPSSRFLVDVSSSLMHGVDRFVPPAGVQNGDLPIFDNVLRTHTGALPFYYLNPMYRGVLFTSGTYVTSAHSFKFGYQFTRSYFGMTDVYSTSSYPSGLVAIFRNNVPDSVNTYDTPTAYRQYVQENAVYAQDKWTPFRKLTVNLGLRFETVHGWQPGACLTQTVFIQGQCFPELDHAPDFKNATPRASAIWDVFGDGRTALKFSANRYDNTVSVSLLTQLNPIKVTNDTRTWTDLNGDRVPQLNELGPSTGFNLGTTNRISPDLVRPHTNEYSVSLEQQLPWQMLATVGYFHRSTRDNFGPQNVAVPTSSYIPITVTEVTSGQQVTVYNQDPALRGRFDTLWDNFPALDTDYNGLDLSVNKRLSNNWMAFGGASFGRNIGDIYASVPTTAVSAATADLNNPNFQFRRGITGDSVPVSLKASAMYQFPLGLSLSVSAQHFTGLPQTTTLLVGSNTVRLTQVTQSIVVLPRATNRYPDVNLADVSLRKTVKLGNFSVEPVLDIYNLFNSNTITAQITQLGPTYGQASGILLGRLIKIGATVNF